jgi:hypothetical protein
LVVQEVPHRATAARRLFSACKELEDATVHVEDDAYLTAHLAWVIQELSTVYSDVVGGPIVADVATGSDPPYERSTWVTSDYFLG